LSAVLKVEAIRVFRGFTRSRSAPFFRGIDSNSTILALIYNKMENGENW
jgi:hypothetical protein